MLFGVIRVVYLRLQKLSSRRAATNVKSNGKRPNSACDSFVRKEQDESLDLFIL